LTHPHIVNILLSVLLRDGLAVNLNLCCISWKPKFSEVQLTLAFLPGDTSTPVLAGLLGKTVALYGGHVHPHLHIVDMLTHLVSLLLALCHVHREKCQDTDTDKERKKGRWRIDMETASVLHTAAVKRGDFSAHKKCNV
jgi:hypothetical protein